MRSWTSWTNRVFWTSWNVWTFWSSTLKTHGGAFSGPITYDEVILGEDLVNKGMYWHLYLQDSRCILVFVQWTGLRFSGQAYGSGGYVGMYLNSVRKMIFEDTDDSHRDVSFSWTLQLNENDEVQLKIDSGKYYVDADSSPSKIYFQGFMLKSSA